MIPILNTYLLLIPIIFIYMLIWFLISLLIKRNDVADIAWGLGFLLITIIVSIFNNFAFNLSLFLIIPIGLWSLRLSIHIYLRNRKKTEDYRYKKWRENWTKYFYIKSFFQVYLFQGLIMLLMSLPIIIAGSIDKEINLFFFLFGLTSFLIGISFETIADWQLTRFINKTENKNKILQTGVWRYSRHPNYFGEVILWWGIWLMTLNEMISLIGIISPLIITFLILKVSGIPLLEEKYKEREDFKLYQKKTNAFWPWLPKKNV